MAFANGFVKLWRKSLQSEVWRDSTLWRLWTWCLMKATYRECEQVVGRKLVRLLPGQFIFGRRRASYETGLSESATRSAIKTLTKLGNITIKTTNKYSIITIVNWESYQVQAPAEQPADAPAPAKQPAERQQNSQQMSQQSASINIAQRESYRVPAPTKRQQNGQQSASKAPADAPQTRRKEVKKGKEEEVVVSHEQKRADDCKSAGAPPLDTSTPPGLEKLLAWHEDYPELLRLWRQIRKPGGLHPKFQVEMCEALNQGVTLAEAEAVFRKVRVDTKPWDLKTALLDEHERAGRRDPYYRRLVERGEV